MLYCYCFKSPRFLFFILHLWAKARRPFSQISLVWQRTCYCQHCQAVFLMSKLMAHFSTGCINYNVSAEPASSFLGFCLTYESSKFAIAAELEATLLCPYNRPPVFKTDCSICQSQSKEIFTQQDGVYTNYLSNIIFIISLPWDKRMLNWTEITDVELHL